MNMYKNKKMKRTFDKLVLGNNCIVTTDSRQTGRNNHVIIIGASGTGKSESIVKPSLCETNEASLVVSDPKGRLIRTYKEYFEEKGYRVRTLDFVNPEKSPCGYDPVRMLSRHARILDENTNRGRIHQILKDQDIMALANLIVRSDPSHKGNNVKQDPFWDDMGVVTLTAFLAAVMQIRIAHDHLLKNVIELTDKFVFSMSPGESVCDIYFKRIEKYYKDCLAVRQYKKVKQMPERTMASVYSSLSSYLGRLSTKELYTFMENDDMVSPVELLEEKTVVFVQCSDSDSSLYFFINMFYVQMMQILFRLKDQERYFNSRPVRFILDDFATNVVIPDMPQWISIMREREISVMLILQSITQLEAIYGREDARTIMSNCDNMVYLRSSDLATAQEFSERLDIPVQDLLYTPIGREYVFLAGQKPIRTTRYDIRNHPDYEKVYNRKDCKKKDDTDEREII